MTTSVQCDSELDPSATQDLIGTSEETCLGCEEETAAIYQGSFPDFDSCFEVTREKVMVRNGKVKYSGANDSWKKRAFYYASNLPYTFVIAQNKSLINKEN